MALDSYGVLVGTLESHRRDTPDDQGRWFHVNLEVTAPAGRYRCAVDVDSKQSATGVQWRVLTLDRAQLPALFDVSAGYHPVATTPTSGALDYMRHPALRTRAGCFSGLLSRAVQISLGRLSAVRAWRAGSNLEAATALESILTIGARIAIFGEPFTSGLGMHNIHQNQGDPLGSQWYAENGTWQDGGTVVYLPDGQYCLFLSKFTTQSFDTNDDGHPR
ncbi:DUF2278 family protein [Micromonospora sp. NPDC002717]|uniref:DUF2278 family protein n=1 Tax=Micromonospora sp. NPDC002717 TaxID=3154424 RepID=UPI00333363D9